MVSGRIKYQYKFQEPISQNYKNLNKIIRTTSIKNLYQNFPFNIRTNFLFLSPKYLNSASSIPINKYRKLFKIISSPTGLICDPSRPKRKPKNSNYKIISIHISFNLL